MLFSRKKEYDECISLLDEQEVIEFLSELIQVNSSNPPGNEINVAYKVHEKLKSYGISSEIWELNQSNRANLMAKIGNNSNGPNLVYSGHYDVVPAGEGWKNAPFGAVIEGDLMYGRGTSDMKAGVTAMTLAMCILKKARVELKGSLSLLGTSGEEVDLYGSRAYVEKYGADGIDAIAISEASNGTVFVAEKGTLWLKFISKGKRAHGGQPKQGVNALTNMIEFMNQLKDLKFKEMENTYLSAPTFSLTTMHAGDLTNIIPDRCEAKVDIRTIPGNDHAALLAQIDAIIEKLKSQNKDMDITYEILHNLLPIETNPNNPLVKSAENSYEQLFSKKPDLQGVVYYTDAVPFREINPEIPVIIYGPGNFTRNHKIDEYVELSSVIDATKFYIALALDYLS